ncbi:MAG: hypothetical protein CME60_03910 [Halobacteriovoraceae bacterium]|nr:hypothetical protein [Halobacteriovoraceae bacterium]
MDNRFPNKILLGLQEGDCNLSCPKCYTHGENAPTDKNRPVETMPFESFLKLCKEMAPFRPRVTPQTWDEPLLTPNLFRYLKAMKDHYLVVTMDTNGVLLNRNNRKALLDLKIDSIFVSIDATTRETYEKVRGKDTFKLVCENVEKLITERGESELPRIGVSFVIEEENSHEEEDFVAYWKNKVDVIRVNKVFSPLRRVEGVKHEESRDTCWSLNDSMMIHPTGKVSLCCVDTHEEVEIGNAFESGISQLWRHGKFEEVRQLHENKEFSKVSICENCNLWSNDLPVKESDDEYVTVRTDTHYYINRRDRINSAPKTNRYLK